jgi:hypothetical protein
MSESLKKFRRMTGTAGPPKRTPSRRPSLPPRECLLLFVLVANVLWLVFALGGVRPWGEIPALLAALATFALIIRWPIGEVATGASPASALIRSPLFWLGLGLWTYLSIQGANLGWNWEYGAGGKPRLISQTPPISWLPAGLESPFDGGNPLRSLMFIALPWFSCLALWFGLSTRRSVTWLLHLLAWIGIAYAALALHQHFTDAEKIFGIFETVPSRKGSDFPFWGSLINGNHAAFLLILVNGLCLGLFISQWHRSLLHYSRGGAWLLYLACALPVTFSILLAQARGALLFLALQWLIFLIICSLFFVRRFGWKGWFFPAGAFGIIAVLVFSFITNPLIFERQKKEWTQTFSLVENPELEARTIMARIASDMFNEKPWYGHGAGGWRYLHLPYLANYPELKSTRTKWVLNETTGKREKREIFTWFENAHVDLMEYLVEWGLVGCAFPLMILLWLLWKGFLARRSLDLGLSMIVISAGIVFLGAAVEFHFRIPLVLLFWSLCLVAPIRLATLRAAAETP